MTPWHLFLILLVAWGPVITIIHLYSKRYINVGSVFIDKDERQIFCYAIDGTSKICHSQEEAVSWLLNVAKPSITRNKVTVLTKKPST